MLSSQIFKENFEVHSPINLDSAKIKAIHLHRDQSDLQIRERSRQKTSGDQF